MLLTILLLGFGIIGYVLFRIFYVKTNSDGWLVLGALGGISFIFGIVLLILTLRNKYVRKVELEEYWNLREQVEHIEKDDIVTNENLRNQVLEMNNRISKNKIYGNTIWISSLYNPELGDCEKLVWKSGK